MKSLQKDNDTSIVLITHDPALLQRLLDHVVVMYAGKAVEYGPVRYLRISHPTRRGYSNPFRVSKTKKYSSSSQSRVRFLV